MPRIKDGEDGHEKNWIEACKGGPAADSNFDYSGPFTETVVMGNLAMLNPFKLLEWDGEKMRFTNDEPPTSSSIRRIERAGRCKEIKG